MRLHGTVKADASASRTPDQGRAIKRQIRDVFYGDSDDWKGMIAGQSLLAARAAIIGLQS